MKRTISEFRQKRDDRMGHVGRQSLQGSTSNRVMRTDMPKPVKSVILESETAEQDYVFCLAQDGLLLHVRPITG